MSDLPQQETIKQYVADGIEDIYFYTYLVPIENDIDVFVTPEGQDANDVADIQPLNVAYTVQDTGNIDGGTITFLPGFIPAANSIVTLSRSVEASIDTNYSATQTINGQNLDNSFEREMLVIQQNQSKFDDRSLRYDISSFVPETTQNNVLPILRTQEIWVGSASGGVAAAVLNEDPDSSTLRSELENESFGTDGAGIVGYYDENNSNPTTVRDFLNGTNQRLQNNVGLYFEDIGVGDNTWKVMPTPAYESLVPGTKVFIKSNKSSNNIASSTLEIDGFGVKNLIVKNLLAQGSLISRNLKNGDVIEEQILEVMYDGTEFQLLNPSSTYNQFPSGNTISGGGVLTQYGISTVVHTSGSLIAQVTFPIEFINNGYSLQLTSVKPTGSQPPLVPLIDVKLNNEFQYELFTMNGSSIVPDTYKTDWVAIGRV